MGRLFRILPAALCLLWLAPGAAAEKIGEVKRDLDGVTVLVSGIVTAIEPIECYIESPDRSSGIWVHASTAAMEIGEAVDVAGTISTVDGERVILDANLYWAQPPIPIRPLGMPGKSIGGSWFGYQDCASDRELVRLYNPDHNPSWYWEWRWVPATGLNNTGLLVKTWGTVTNVDFAPGSGTRWFFIDDGSGLLADLGDSGLLVASDADVKPGEFVAVTGISSVECCLDDATRLIRVIRPRGAWDVQVFREPTPREYPFSDEFDESFLDPRWAYSRGSGAISVASNPGWVRFVMPENGLDGPELIQRLGDTWTVDVKLRADFSLNATTTQWVEVQLRDTPFWGWPPPRPPGVYPGSVAQLLSLRGGVYLVLANSQTFPVPPDATCYLRVRRTGSWYEVSYSLDGVTYFGPARGEGGSPYLVISTYSETSAAPGRPFAAYCDYFRYSPTVH